MFDYANVFGQRIFIILDISSSSTFLCLMITVIAMSSPQFTPMSIVPFHCRCLIQERREFSEPLTYPRGWYFNYRCLNLERREFSEPIKLNIEDSTSTIAASFWNVEN